jgi:hypothetical protein
MYWNRIQFFTIFSTRPGTLRPSGGRHGFFKNNN